MKFRNSYDRKSGVAADGAGNGDPAAERAADPVGREPVEEPDGGNVAAGPDSPAAWTAGGVRGFGVGSDRDDIGSSGRASGSGTPEMKPDGKGTPPPQDPAVPDDRKLPLKRRYIFPTWGDLLAFVGMFAVIQLIVSLIFMLCGIRMPAMLPSDASEEMTAAFADECARYHLYTYPVVMGLMIVATLIYRRLRHGNSSLGRYATRGFDPTLILWGILLMIATGIVLEPLQLLLPEIPDVYGRGWRTLLTTVVIAPVAEEFLFRGILLDAARAKRGVIYGLLFSSLAFGLVHLQPVLVINAFVLGLVLGFVYIRTDSLYINIILHAFNNALVILLYTLGYGGTTLRDLLGNPDGWGTLYTTVYLMSALLLLFSGYMIWRTVARLHAHQVETQGSDGVGDET